MNFSGKKVLVCGMALSGVSAALLLKKLGAAVTIQDIKPFEKVTNELKKLEGTDIKTHLGQNPDDIINTFDLIVMSPGIPLDLPFLNEARKLSIPIWSEIELASSVCPCTIVAITGTNGKTTTTALVGAIMKEYKGNVEVVGNIGVPFSEKVSRLNADDYVVAEISSFQLESSEHFNPKACAVLNITPDHLNRHKTLENYIETKKRIFKNQTENDFTILNYDDKAVQLMEKDSNGKIVFFSAKEQLDEGVFVDTDKNICILLDGIKKTVIKADELQILGKHNLENALAAVALTASIGVPIEIIEKALKNFKGVPHRLEFVAEAKGIAFYNDSKATNPDAAIKAIESIERPIVLIAGGYDKGSDFSDWVKLFQGKVKHVVVLGEVTNAIIETLKSYSYNNYDKVNSLKSAVDLCYSKAEKGDCVLLSPACASWDMFDNFEERGRIFKEFAMEIASREGA